MRPAFYSADAENGRRFLFGETAGNGENAAAEKNTKKPILLVLGGSLGAHQINQLVQQNLDWLCEHFTVVHQTGRADEAMTQIQHAGYHPYTFIYKEMCDVIAAADVVLSRAGANSIWECAVLEKPLVLIPLCGSGTRGDQVDNAQFFVEQHAALMLLGDEADSDHLRAALAQMEDADFRASCSAACKKMTGEKRPAKEIARLVYKAVSVTENV